MNSLVFFEQSFTNKGRLALFPVAIESPRTMSFVFRVETVFVKKAGFTVVSDKVTVFRRTRNIFPIVSFLTMINQASIRS